MIEFAKKVLAKMGIYENIINVSFLKLYLTFRMISKKNNESLITSIRKCKLCKNNYHDIFSKADINNIGKGDFFYSLDERVVVLNKKRMISNIPVDYSLILETDFNQCEHQLLDVIYDYMRKINDPRITLSRPTCLKEALQTILFWNSLLWQTGHKLVGLGRLDKVLSKYPVPYNAEELITDFLQTLHQAYEFKSSALLGDTGQIIILGGLEADGSYFCNEYTYLFIECLKNMQSPDPKVMLRASAKMPQKLIEVAVASIASGIGSPLISNDDVVIDCLIDFGYDVEDAFNYGVSACWEPLSIGNSLEQNNLFNIEYGQYINKVLTSKNLLRCKSFDDVLNMFLDNLRDDAKYIIERLDCIQWEQDPLLSYMMKVDDDIARGGAKYNNYGILSVGLSSAINSLLNLDRNVFLEKRISLKDVRAQIVNNYPEGNSAIFSKHLCYGTNDPGAIYLTNFIIEETEKCFSEYRNRFGGKVKFGLSSPAYLGSGNSVGATLDGRCACEPFSIHISNDKNESPTDIINFASQLRITGLSSNANVVDIVVSKNLIQSSFEKFVAYIKGAITSGIFQMQFNVLLYEQLVDAKLHPEKYPNLIVRVWGFSAHYIDLPIDYQDYLIQRAKYITPGR